MNTLVNNKITIDIVSDVVCPWCYVGKKRLEDALEQLGNPEDVEITWHPFQLDPTIPAEGMDRKKYFIKKFGDEGRIRQMSEHLTQVGKEAGIDFNLDEISESINTLPLHKLLHVAGQEGFQSEAEEMLFQAYFSHGKDLKNLKVLAELFAPFGWDEAKIEGIVADDTIGYAVRQEIDHFQQMGVSGVPFFIINNKYGISGAQPAEVLVQALTQVREEVLEAATGEVCGPEGC
ncbi:DsbA family oxidoreductase [Persicitalea jodogahamensis]|uniref:DSBA oxidoreductase n=1 Tax=Persicitalea jodogahamensis TaxID=402147 RepID=A0A8J3GAD1_9BACT|nr:DsbA family oxidoreductase [Persicitalea jodogahamensis]GHB73285.1 DSBA oxidoreductase [Persicitalea jodogahamensis]